MTNKNFIYFVLADPIQEISHMGGSFITQERFLYSQYRYFENELEARKYLDCFKSHKGTGLDKIYAVEVSKIITIGEKSE